MLENHLHGKSDEYRRRVAQAEGMPSLIKNDTYAETIESTSTSRLRAFAPSREPADGGGGFAIRRFFECPIPSSATRP